MARAIRTQHDQRRFVNPLDQFGRKWFMTIEILTGDPTGAVLPAGWDDPLHTPGHYVEVPRLGGQTVLGKCEVAFPRWIRAHEADEEAWYKQLFENARSVYKKLDQGGVAELEHDKYLIELTGPKPWPSSAVLKAAQKGHPAFLGLKELTAEDRVALAIPTVEDYRSGAVRLGERGLTATAVEAQPVIPEIPETYKEFLGWAFKHGGAKSLSEAAALWKTHRDALQSA